MASLLVNIDSLPLEKYGEAGSRCEMVAEDWSRVFLNGSFIDYFDLNPKRLCLIFRGD